MKKPKPIEQFEKPSYPVKILQFGEGNFLRAFADLMVDMANEAGVFEGCIAIVKPRPGSTELYRMQNSNYTVILRGDAEDASQNVCRVITSVRQTIDCYTEYQDFIAFAELDSLRFIISNTTEAGIVYDGSDSFDACPPQTFPAKLTKLLFTRYRHFDGSPYKGLIILPTELIDDNGQTLLECIRKYAALWDLDDGFLLWLDEACTFCDTLVNRIVTGFPKEEADKIFTQLGYTDQLLVTGDPHGQWIIRSDCPEFVKKEFPLHLAGMAVEFTADLRPYKERKVRVLNGAHTVMALASYLVGLDTVGECMADCDIHAYMEYAVFDEIVPYVPFQTEDITAYARTNLAYYKNPFIRHNLLSIALNSISKWRARLLPSFRDYVAENRRLPDFLTFSFAALLAFYTGDRIEDGILIGNLLREHPVKDDQTVLVWFLEHSTLETEEFVRQSAANRNFWGEDLSLYDGFVEKATGYLEKIRAYGIRGLIQSLLADRRS